MEPHRISNPGTNPGGTTLSFGKIRCAGPVTKLDPAQQPTTLPRTLIEIFAVLSFLCAPTLAHWTDPAVIVNLMQNDTGLRDHLGVFEVTRDKRLLVVRVLRAKWDAAPAEVRAKLATEWRETWRHNVPGGIVAVLDATNDRPLVNYDGEGKPRLAPSPEP
ncbi:MAG TPA: hypothetical protein VMT89_13125 [Candidatus Acidoferrales bacterium]|nr:hypothetical protein [Candidatus Acidoferrales bacterium]